MNTSRPSLASRSIDVIKPSGERAQVVLLIGQPYEVTPQEWAIPVSMNGLHERLWNLHGIDSWQVVQLGFEFIVQMLEYFVQDGGQLYWPETDERFEPAELLPQRRLPSA